MEIRRQEFPEQLGYPVVFSNEYDVHGGEEGMLVDAVVAGHEVLVLLWAEEAGVGTDLAQERNQLLEYKNQLFCVMLSVWFE